MSNQTDNGVGEERRRPVTEPAPSPAPHWLALFTNSHGCTPTPRLGFLPFNGNRDLGPAAGQVPAACRLLYLLPVGTALLPLRLLAGCLCKATRGHRVEPADCGPARGQGAAGGRGAGSQPDHTLPIAQRPNAKGWERGALALTLASHGVASGAFRFTPALTGEGSAAGRLPAGESSG